MSLKFLSKYNLSSFSIGIKRFVSCIVSNVSSVKENMISFFIYFRKPIETVQTRVSSITDCCFDCGVCYTIFNLIQVYGDNQIQKQRENTVNGMICAKLVKAVVHSEYFGLT